MKRRVILLVILSSMISSMILPTLAVESNQNSAVPDVEISWSITRGEDDDCGHYPPRNYRYIGVGKGNTTQDMKICIDIVNLILLLVLPKGYGPEEFGLHDVPIFDHMITELGKRTLKDGTKVWGDYRYEEYWKDPCSWRHYTFKLCDADGNILAFPCCAVNSCRPGEVERVSELDCLRCPED